MKKWRLAEFIAAAAMLFFLFAACQPQTVIVERRDGELVPVTPDPWPQFRVIKRGEIRIGAYDHTVYKLIDVEEKQTCTMISYTSSGSYKGMLGLSCRPMTNGEYRQWK